MLTILATGDTFQLSKVKEIDNFIHFTVYIDAKEFVITDSIENKTNYSY